MEQAEMKMMFSAVALLGLLMNQRTGIVTDEDMNDATDKAIRIGKLMAKKMGKDL